MPHHEPGERVGEREGEQHPQLSTEPAAVEQDVPPLSVCELRVEAVRAARQKVDQCEVDVPGLDDVVHDPEPRARGDRGSGERPAAQVEPRASSTAPARPTSAGSARGFREHRERGCKRNDDVGTIFTDIRGFTTLVESADPDVLGVLLNEYVEGMTGVVFAHEGTVAKIIGDGIHVLFNAPGEQPDYATRAVACARDLDSWAQEFRQRWKKRGVDFGITRIGVHAGPALVGNFGGSEYFDYTAHGDTINTASRLESANKQLGTRICVSETDRESRSEFQGPAGRRHRAARAQRAAANL